MTDVVRSVLAQYLRGIGGDQLPGSPVQNRLVYCADLLESGVTDDALYSKIKELCDREDVKASTWNSADYIRNSRLSVWIQDDLIGSITTEHSKQLIQYTVMALLRSDKLTTSLAHWFRYPQWHTSFLSRLLTYDDFTSRCLLRMNPAMCEHFAMHVACRPIPKYVMEVLGSFGPSHAYMFNVNPDILCWVNNKLTEDGDRPISLYTSQEIEHRVLSVLSCTHIPDHVKEFEHKYFLPYSKLLEYKEFGADCYRNASILDIWANVMGAY